MGNSKKKKIIQKYIVLARALSALVGLMFAGYQLTSAECYDLRSSRVVADQYCHYYPENVKPKPKLQECNLDPCPARSVQFTSLFIRNTKQVSNQLLR